MQTMTHSTQCNARPRLLMALELGQRQWKVGFTVGLGQRPRTRSLTAGALPVLLAEIARAKEGFELAPTAGVVSCYEAGRDGFWIHRCLAAQGITNYVVDSSSIEVNQRARRMKTDSLDLAGLLCLLARHEAGDPRGWRVVRVPTVEEEDARQLHRTRETLQHDRTRLINRLKAGLATQGVAIAITEAFGAEVAAARLWDGMPLPAGLQRRLLTDWTQLQAVEQQLAEITAVRDALPVDPATPTGRYVAELQRVRAIGPTGAWVLATEIFGWRQIRNGRELGALVGLVPGRYHSGEQQRDLGITGAGNRRVRWVMVQLAWGWVRYQPTSALTQWYQQQFGHGSRRLRRIGIVALARKLLVALWHYVEHGVMIEGAVLKSTKG